MSEEKSLEEIGEMAKTAYLEMLSKEPNCTRCGGWGIEGTSTHA